MKPNPRQLVAALAVVAALIPIRSVTAPEWTIQFVDAKGRPFSSLPVSQTWQNYSFEDDDHYDDAVTDTNGNVTFPERTVWSPLLFRAIGPGCSLARSGVHASFGPTSWVIAKCDLIEQGSRGATYTGESLPSKVQLGYLDRSGIRKMVPGAMEPAPQCKQIEQQAREAGA